MRPTSGLTWLRRVPAQLRRVPYRLRSQALRSRPGQRLAAHLGRQPHPERWVFIIACYNSGTTLLKDLLAEHPDVGVLPGEGVRFTDVLPRPEPFGWNRMWCRCLDPMRLDPGPGTAPLARRIQRQWSVLYPQGRTSLLEKSIANAARLPFLQAHFQPACFVYLVRDGYAVAEGMRRKAQPGRWGNPLYRDQYPIELCAEQWLETDRRVRQDATAETRLLQVTYEDLTADPAGVMGRITDFLGIPPLSGEVLGRRWRVHGVESPIRNMNEQSLARLTGADLDAVERVAGEALDRYGYRRPSL